MTDTIQQIPLEKIKPNPYQPREHFDKDRIEEMAESFKTVGVLQHIMVRPHGSGFQIAMGERRWKAAQMAKMKNIPAIVRDIDDRTLQLYSVVENLHRKNLNSIEEEKAIYELWKKYYEPVRKTQGEMGKDLGKSKSYVNDKVTAYERRKELGVTREQHVSSRDVLSTIGLDKVSAKKLLDAKSKGFLDTRDLDRTIPAMRKASPERRKVIVKEVIAAGELKEKYSKDVGEVSEAYANGYDGIPRIEKSADIKRMEKFMDLWEQVRWWGPEVVMMIKDVKLRKKAVEAMSDTGDHLTKLAARIRKEDWYGKA